jgi:HNH endonuclease
MNYSKGIYSNRNWLYKRYVKEKMSLRNIAKICKVDFKTIDYWIKLFNFPKHRVGDPGGVNSPHWNGGLYNDKGYQRISQGRKIGYKLEHRIIVEQSLGRKLTKSEVIHHINFLKSDNNLNNLYLFPSQSEHKRYHQLYKSGKVALLKSNLSTNG